MKSTLISSQGESDFPVIKIGLDFTVLDCNLSAMPLLNHWKCKVNSRIPDDIMATYPGISNSLKSTEESSLHVAFKDFMVRFTVVPFPEAGYIGLYGYQVEKSERVVVRFNDIKTSSE